VRTPLKIFQKEEFVTFQNVLIQMNEHFWLFCPLHMFFISMVAAWVAENIYIIILHREMQSFLFGSNSFVPKT